MLETSHHRTRWTANTQHTAIEQNSRANDNTSFTNNTDKICDSFENVNFYEDLTVTTKQYNQIERFFA